MSARRKKPVRAKVTRLWALVNRIDGSVVWANLRRVRWAIRADYDACGSYRIARVEIREVTRKGKRT